jgi:high-affinity iron transporter
MLVSFLIVLREGVEAALIVGLIAGYLRHAGLREWVPLVWVGVAIAALLSLGAGIVLEMVGSEFPQHEQELFEAVVGLVAVGILTAMVFWMRRAAGGMKGQLQASVEVAIGSGSGMALIGMVFFAVMREGLEAVFFLLAVFQQNAGWGIPAGAVLGLLAAVAVGFAVYWGGARINLARFFRWTGGFVLIVAAGLLAGSLRALHEAGLWNSLQNVPFDASAWLPVDGAIGTVLAGMFGYSDRPAIGEILAYVVFLAVVMPMFLRGPRSGRRAGDRLQAKSGA